MEDKYPKAYKEVDEILKHMPSESVEKIPETFRKMFKEKMDFNYDFKLDESVEFEKQELLDETKAILANFYRDYWASEEERNEIIEKEKIELKKIEEEKREKYNPDDLFKNKNKKDNINEFKEGNNEDNESINKNVSSAGSYTF